jgi:PadR family transcriptional regulator, regulatory protein PadR
MVETDFFDNWTTQLRKGTLELCVLCALRVQRLYGYDLVKQLRVVGGLVMSEGTVYPMLSRFKKEGLVTTTLVESSEGPARKYYELTPRGRDLVGRMFAHWSAVRGGIDTLGGEVRK